MPVLHSAWLELRQRGWRGFSRRALARLHHHYIALTESFYFRYRLPRQFKSLQPPSPLAIGPDYLHDTAVQRELLVKLRREEHAAIIAACDRLLAFDFSDFSAAYQPAPDCAINWHVDYLTGRLWPLTSGHNIDYSSAERPGDIRVMWEMHRHLFFMFLGVGYLLSGDERYVLFFKQQFHEWVKQNPVGRGLAWNGPQIQENGIRNIAWIWSSLLFRASPTLTAGDRRLLHRLIYIQGGFINRYMNPHKELSHNHLISEAGGLFLTGLFFSNRRRGRIWLKRAQRVFTEALHFQVHPDGVQGEFSAHYHAFVMETALQVLLFGKEAGIEFPEEFSDRIRGMLRFVVDITHPDGTLPQFGDTDNATAFALTPRRVEDRSRYRSLAATLFRDPTFLRPGDQLHAETILLLGSSARQLFDELSSPTETETCSESYYPSVNLLTREHQDTGLHDKLVYRGGGAVFPHRMGTGHNHADQGGFEYWVNGEVIYSDSGTWSYSFADSWRYFFRSAQAHNTVTVDDQDPLPVRLDRFGIPRMAPVRTSFRQQTSISSVISTTCDITVDPGWRHTRNVTHFSTGVLIIDDLVGCPGEHRLGQHFNLNGKVKLYGKSPAGVVIETGQQQLRQIWLEPVTLRQVCGGGDPPAGWHSPRYGYKVPREHLIAELLFRDQVKLTTVIAPTGIELLDADIIVIKKRNYSPRRENPGWQLEQDQL